MTSPAPLSRRPARAARHRRAFTLIELLIAAAIGSGLLVSMAAVAHLFGEQMTDVRTEKDVAAEETLAGLTHDIRSAWSVTQPSAQRLRLYDPFGNTTDVFCQSSALQITRPSGATGTLLPGVASVGFDLKTTPRLRETTPVSQVRTCWTSPAAGAASTVMLVGGNAIAIGFTLPVAAPSSLNVVSGISEQRTSTTLSRLLLPVGWLDGGNPQFCHLHATPPHNPSHPSGTGTVTVELYEARAPGDGRPLGAMLGSKVLTAGTLPSAAYTWWDRVNNKVVSPPSGVAWGWWDWFQDNWQVVLVINAGSLSTAALDLSSMHATLLPGRAYTLVLRVAGYDELVVQTGALASSKLSGTALQTVAGGAWTPQPSVVTCVLEGNETFTQTSSQTAVTSVTMTITMQDGRVLNGSAAVLGQLATDDPWLGAVPGETPTLDLAGS